MWEACRIINVQESCGFVKGMTFSASDGDFNGFIEN